MTQISESRTRELLQWLDDQAGDHTHLFEQMARYRDAAALIRQLQAAEQSAWHAGLDAGREQGRGKDHAQQPPSALVGVVEAFEEYHKADHRDPAVALEWEWWQTAWKAAAAPQPVVMDAHDAEIDALRAEVAAQRTRADAMAGEAIKHEALAERMAEALRYAVDNPEFDSETFDKMARDALDAGREQARAAVTEPPQVPGAR